MSSLVLITGGTGTLGRHVVRQLRGAGRELRVLSRRAHPSSTGVEHVVGDLLANRGIERAVDGAEIVVHCAGSARGDDEATRNLVRAASKVSHLVYISVVGADRIPVVGAFDRALFGYFASKRAAERVIVESGVPWTTLRAAQFHDLMLSLAQKMERLPLIPVPADFRFQPVDTGEVASRLVELALGVPAGLVPDFAGPCVHALDEIVRAYLRARGERKLFVPLWIPGKAAAAVRAGATLALDGATGRRTWDDFLAERVSDRRRRYASPCSTPTATSAPGR